MKQLLLGLLSCFGALGVTAQTIMSNPDAERFDLLSQDVRANIMGRYTADSPAQARAKKMYNRWESFWSTRFCSDMPAGVSSLAPISEALDYALRIPISSGCLGSSSYSGNWSCIGPYYNTYNCTGSNCQTSGRMMNVWVHPTNKNYILAGSSGGGLWKTTDAGLNWSNITDNAPQVIPGTIGVFHLAVNPLNTNIIYLATNGAGTREKEGFYGLGLVYSTNGGATWNADHDFRTITGDNVYEGVGAEISKLAYHPGTQRLYAIYRAKVYVKTSQTAAWQNITPAFMTSNMATYGYKLSDFEFTNSATNQVVFSTDGQATKHHLYIYNETSGTWTSKEVVFSPGNVRWGMMDIAISGTDEVYINYWGTSDYDHKLYKTGLAQSSPLTLLNNSLHAIARVLVVSPVNPNIIYLTNCQGWSDFIERSTNGGASFQTLGNTHADGRSIFLDAATTSANGINDVIYCATDGGIAMKPAGSNTFRSLMGNGICVAQFTGMSSSPSRNMLAAGAIDNGTQAYIKENAVPWSIPQWADGLIPAFARNGVLQAYFMDQGGVTNRFDFSSGTPVSGPWIGNPPDNMGAGVKWWKPMKFDHNNVARLGFHSVWQRPLSGSSWQPAFGSLPAPQDPKGNVNILDTPHAINEKPVDFIFPEYDGNLVYVAYGDPNWDDDGRTNKLRGKLFYSYDYLTSGGYPTWKNVTPPYIIHNPINDIEVDPFQPNRIFVAYGGVRWDELAKAPMDRKARVLYHPMYGENFNLWQDISKGLPAVPINKLLYVEGSDDVIFAATDIGVYRWNKAAQQWECFNTGMPKVMATDLELNYCSGKLRIATYGRGIWETDYAPNMDNSGPVGFAYKIISNTTWSSSKSLSGSVLVKTGQTLTISGSSTKIYMPRKARILVEPGAKLIVDGATLTNECGFLWQGIEVMGNINQVSADVYQGALELKNGAVIEHAINGFRNLANDNGMQGGGIIRAKNATFKNCKRAVELVNAPHHTYWSSTMVNTSNCSFDGVTFLRDNAAIPLDQEAYFTSWLTKGGVVIKNSTFVNLTPYGNQPQHQRGTALSVYSTGMTVQGCTFQGFRRGLASGSINGDPAQSVTVHNNSFQFITENITMSAAAYGDIRGNTISMMYPSLSNKAPYGIYLDNTFGSYVGCSNNVDGAVVTVPSYGIIANNTSRYQTIVSRNTISNCKFGLQTQNHNPSLTISCNTFTTNSHALSVNPASPGGGNRLKDQGTGCASNQTRAGNKFNNNSFGIVSYLNNSWKYFAGNGTNEQPSWFGTMTFGACNTPSSCGFTFECVQMVTPGQVQQGVDRYLQLKAAGEEDGFEAQTILGDVVRGYNSLDDIAGLTTFLEGQSGDERIKKQLIPLYIGQFRFEDAANMVAELNVSDQERQGYVDYYTLIGTLKQEGRGINALTPDEFNMVKNLSTVDLEVTPYAKALLEAASYVEWVHPIEDQPVDPLVRKAKIPVSQDRIESTLLNAAPNPADHTATINVLVSKMDAAKKSFVIVRNINGAEVYRSTSLAAGENSIAVDTRNWATGLYLYSLVTDNKVMATQKLVIAR